MLNRALIGKAYPPVSLEVTAAHTERFAEAVGDSASVGRHEVPITFTTVLTMKALRPVLEDPQLGLDVPDRVHGGQELEFIRAVQVGDRLLARATVEDIYAKGALHFGLLRVDVTDQAGDPVLNVRSTMIVRERP